MSKDNLLNRGGGIEGTSKTKKDSDRKRNLF